MILYFCKSQERRLKVAANSQVNGIDYLEVSPIDQTILEVHFIHPLPGESGGVPSGTGQTLQEGNILIKGGVRIKEIEVTSIAISGNLLTVQVSSSGDFSFYSFMLVASPTDESAPSGFDPRLASLEFSFKANCPSDFDCKPDIVCPPEVLSDPHLNYLAKDFASFKRLMLDRMSLIMPSWTERNPADLQVALVELLAYTGDYLSYYQDAVATESYLFKARLRTSARRHARLLDYHMHDGCNARAWVFLEVEKGGGADTANLPTGTALLTKGPIHEVSLTQVDFLKANYGAEVKIFETLHDLTLHSVHNELSFYTWDDLECCLPKGATKATLYRKDQDPIHLTPGHVLIFEEVISPTTGVKADADLLKRCAVRLTKVTDETDVISNINVVEIEWHESDALPFAMCISERVNGVFMENISIARGNIVLADHGLKVEHNALNPSFASGTEVYKPLLLHQGITVSTSYDHVEAVSIPANETIRQDPSKAVPVITLIDGEDSWQAQRDLLASSRFAKEFVAEIESDLSVRLRFGDDYLGEKPGDGFQPKATYRLGNGLSGNVGPEAIGRIVFNPGGITKVRNPLPAQSGTDQESIEQVKQFAPEAFRTQERAVTEADYATKTKLHPEVQNAVAQFRWTGSWHTVFLIIDRKEGIAIDDTFEDEIRLHLEKYRMAGYDLEIISPVFVPLEIEMRICVKAGYFKSAIQEKLQSIFSRFELPSGELGFFHPDNFTFGQPIYASALIDRAMSLDGVLSVELKTFKRLHRPSNAFEVYRIMPDGSEIIQLENDPSFPENGKINFIMQGGL